MLRKRNPVLQLDLFSVSSTRALHQWWDNKSVKNCTICNLLCDFRLSCSDDGAFVYVNMLINNCTFSSPRPPKRPNVGYCMQTM